MSRDEFDDPLWRPIEFSYAYRYGTLRAAVTFHVHRCDRTADDLGGSLARLQWLETAEYVSDTIRRARWAERRRAA